MLKIYFGILIAVFIVMQFIRPTMENPPVVHDKELKAPKEVMSILKRSCYDCHSNETKWPAYSSIAPLSWTIADHVNTGREILNYSEWSDYSKEKKAKKFERTIQTLNTGLMPLPSYLWIHKDAKLSPKDKKILKSWAKDELSKLGVDTF